MVLLLPTTKTGLFPLIDSLRLGKLKIVDFVYYIPKNQKAKRLNHQIIKKKIQLTVLKKTCEIL